MVKWVTRSWLLFLTIFLVIGLFNRGSCLVPYQISLCVWKRCCGRTPCSCWLCLKGLSLYSQRESFRRAAMLKSLNSDSRVAGLMFLSMYFRNIVVSIPANPRRGNRCELKKGLTGKLCFGDNTKTGESRAIFLIFLMFGRYWFFESVPVLVLMRRFQFWCNGSGSYFLIPEFLYKVFRGYLHFSHFGISLVPFWYHSGSKPGEVLLTEPQFTGT